MLKNFSLLIGSSWESKGSRWLALERVHLEEAYRREAVLHFVLHFVYLFTLGGRMFAFNVILEVCFFFFKFVLFSMIVPRSESVVWEGAESFFVVALGFS